MLQSQRGTRAGARQRGPARRPAPGTHERRMRSRCLCVVIVVVQGRRHRPSGLSNTSPREGVGTSGGPVLKSHRRRISGDEDRGPSQHLRFGRLGPLLGLRTPPGAFWGRPEACETKKETCSLKENAKKETRDGLQRPSAQSWKTLKPPARLHCSWRPSS